MSSPRKEGVKKILIIYVEITWNTDLIRTSLPALDSAFPLQEFIFFPHTIFDNFEHWLFASSYRRWQPQTFACTMSYIHIQHDSMENTL